MPYLRAHQDSSLRIVAFTSALLLAAAIFVMAPQGRSADSSGNSGYRYSRSDKCLMHKINGARSRHGLGRLNWDAQLSYVSRRHAVQMASYRTVWHDGNVTSEVTRWKRLGQNSGAGKTCRAVFRAFMRSPEHRKHILGHWRFVGVGSATSGRLLYVQQVFEARRDPGNVYSRP